MKLPVVITLILFSMISSSCNSDGHELTVMTFNIRYDNPRDGENRWEARIPVVKAYMDSVAPDIAGMQEVLHNQIHDLLEIMPGYSYTGVGRDDGKTGGEYSPIYFRNDRFTLGDHSTFWLSETPDVPGSRSWDAAITRIVSWAELHDSQSGKTVYVFNTHFDHRGVEARRESIRLISEKIEEIAGEFPVILLGDFNIRKSSEDYDLMTSVFSGNRLTNVEYISRTPVTGAGSTFNGFRHDTEPRVIDFIYVDQGFGVSSYGVDRVIEDGVFISDHWPVVSVITY